MRVFQQTKKLAPALNNLLRQAGPGLDVVYNRSYSTSLPILSDIKFTSIKTLESDDAQGFIDVLSNKVNGKRRVDVTRIYQTSSDDIDLSSENKSSQLVLVSKDDISVKYGESGKAPSADFSPHDLLTKSIAIPKNQFGVLDIPHHTPFLIGARNPQEVFVLKACELKEVLDYDNNIKEYSLTKVVELPSETARIISLRLQQSILEDKKNEYFYEEITSRLYPPSKSNRSSGTLMSFVVEDEHKKSESDTTATHYHPGERSLYIFTTGKAAGATLNFCGINESPEERKDCEVRLKFQKNSLSVLNFPPHTHHKFEGEFVCISVHPREGENLIEALQNGSLPKGFLESATVFSNTSNDKKEEWKLSPPLITDYDESKIKSR